MLNLDKKYNLIRVPINNIMGSRIIFIFKSRFKIIRPDLQKAKDDVGTTEKCLLV